MVTVRMVQSTVYKIVDVVTMRHLFMSAVWTMCVGAVDFRRAFYGIRRVDGDGMFVNVILVHMVEMAVVKIIHVAIMQNCSVPAIRAMLMRVVVVVFLGTCGHERYSLRGLGSIDHHQCGRPWNSCRKDSDAGILRYIHGKQTEQNPVRTM